MEQPQPHGNEDETTTPKPRLRFPTTGLREMPSFESAGGAAVAREYEQKMRAQQREEDQRASEDPDPSYDYLRPMGDS